jgi:peptidyl-prolyl cis-trans isomerase C
MPAKLSLLSCAGALALLAAAPAVAQTPAAPAAPTAAPAAPAAAPAAPVDPKRVVARVDGEPITEADLATAAEDPALALPGTDAAQKREVLIGYVIDLRLGARAARAGKIDASPEFKRRLDYLSDKLLVDEYLEAETKSAVTAEAAQKLYDESVKEMKPEEEVRARHILVAEEDVAKKVQTRLKAGEDFAKVAEEVSTDPGSKGDGGDLGFFTKDRMVAPFAEAAFKLKPTEISEPVKSQFGWHVIQVTDRRTKPVPTFAEMRTEIDQYLARRAQQEAVLKLRKTGKVERVDPPISAPKQ